METDYSTPSSDNKINDYLKLVLRFAGPISWIIFLVTGWLTFFEPDFKIYEEEDGDIDSHNGMLFWLYTCFPTTNGYEMPLYIYFLIFYILIILALLVSTVGFIFYVYYFFVKKEDNVINGMTGLFSQFHCVPFICCSILFMISESVKFHEGNIKDEKDFLEYNMRVYISNIRHFLNILFTFIGLASIICVYIKTNIETPIYAKYTINRGTYSFLLALLVFNTFYSISSYGLKSRYEDVIDYYKSKEGEKFYDAYNDYKDWVKGCSYTFSILLAPINLVLSFFFKDLILAGINGLMYIGMAINFFMIDDNMMKDIFDDKKILGVIDIIMIVASISLIAFIIIKYRLFFFNQQME